jgi:hypothetical protein
MEPGGLMPHSQMFSNTPYPEPIDPIVCFDTYFFTIYPDIVLQPHLGLPSGLFL